MLNHRATPLFSAGVLFLNMVEFQMPLLGALSLAIYVLTLSRAIGRRLFSEYPGTYGSLILLTYWMVAGTLVYYPYTLTMWTTTALLAGSLFFLFLPKKFDHPFVFPSVRFAKSDAYLLLPLISSIVLILFIFHKQTTTVMPSPWTALGLPFLLLYTLGTIGLFVALYFAKHRGLRVLMTMMHLFVTYSITALLYPLGFGFDGFIHRAAHTAIADGNIFFPKQPQFAGQYSLIVVLHQLTSIKIFFLDVLLVPILAALALPTLLPRIISRVWESTSTYIFHLIWIVPFLFFFALSQSSPVSLLILLTIVFVFAMFGYLRDAVPIHIPLLLVLMAITLDIVIGIPLALFVGMGLLLQHNIFAKYTSYLLPTFILLLVLIVPLLFLLVLYITHQPLPHITNPLLEWSGYLTLFERPATFASSQNIFLELLYVWERFIGPIIAGFGLFGWYAMEKTKKDDITHQLGISTTITFVIISFLLYTMFSFAHGPTVIQQTYALLFLHLSIIFLLPYALYQLNICLDNISKRIWALPTIFVTISVVLTFSLYLAYPQENEKVHPIGTNVTAQDMLVVERIAARTADQSLVVLANPSTAVAALATYPIYIDSPEGKIHPYAIPSGGTLVEHYNRIIAGTPIRDVVSDVFAWIEVERVYIVLSNYNERMDNVVDDAKATAHSWQAIGEGELYLFEYKQH